MKYTKAPQSHFTSGASLIARSLQPTEKEVGMATLMFRKQVVKIILSEMSIVNPLVHPVNQ